MKISRKSWHFKLAEFAGYEGYEKQLNIGSYAISVFVGSLPFWLDFFLIFGIFMGVLSPVELTSVIFSALTAIYLVFTILFSYLEGAYYGPFWAWKHVFGKNTPSIFEIEITD